MAGEFKPGDVVRLKSGGPKMTINSIGKFNYEDYESASCDWFTQDKAPWKAETGTYPLHSLEKA